MTIDKAAFYDGVRAMFGGALTQQQVAGMDAILDTWDAAYDGMDLRWLANPLAQTKWETASTMWAITEYGKGAGQPYGVPDKETGQTYYGRGLIQCTWRTNYHRADVELGLFDAASTEWNADNMLDIDTAAAVMFRGMMEGWFRSDSKGPHTLARYFNSTTDDPVNAREIINGDKNYTKDWLPKGMTVGQYIAKDHGTFLVALELAYMPTGLEPLEQVVTINVTAPPGVRVDINVKETGDGTA